MPDLDVQAALEINAFTGVVGEASSPAAADVKRWGVAQPAERPRFLAALAVDARDYRHADVGWGLLLADDDALPAAEKATPADAPAAIQRLWESRPGSPVFRYRSDGRAGFLRRYYPDGGARDLSVLGARGLGDKKLPFYLLIVGSPVEIPWEVQFFLNGPCRVGRLDLDGAGLERYVDALINDWSDTATTMERPVVWAVDHGHGDITSLMRHAIAEPVVARLDADGQIGGSVYLTGARASAAELGAALAANEPALVLTSSHGMTGPTDDPATMAAQLGLPVDTAHDLVGAGQLLATGWQPDGAIWFAQACCSAGAFGANRFEGLLEDGSSVDRLLDAVAALGPMVAPLPTALLSAEKPLRAFIGQVDPTFNWTLQSPTGQAVTDAMIAAISPSLHLADPKTIGMALEHYYGEIGTLYRMWSRHRADAGAMVPGSRTAAIDARLSAEDRESLVILGDPTVVPTALPPL